MARATTGHVSDARLSPKPSVVRGYRIPSDNFRTSRQADRLIAPVSHAFAAPRAASIRAVRRPRLGTPARRVISSPSTNTTAVGRDRSPSRTTTAGASHTSHRSTSSRPSKAGSSRSRRGRPRSHAGQPSASKYTRSGRPALESTASRLSPSTRLISIAPPGRRRARKVTRAADFFARSVPGRGAPDLLGRAPM